MQLSIYGAIATAIVDTNVSNLTLSCRGGNKWTRTTDLTLIRRVL